MRIEPTAAYLLAAASAPEKARLTAIERAVSGNKITTAVATEFIAKERNKATGEVQNETFAK